MATFYSDAAPAIVSGQTTITLANYANNEFDYNTPDYIMHTSAITGKRTLVAKGTYTKIALDLLDITYALYASLKACRGTTVTFYPYGTANITIGQATYTAPSFSALVTEVRFFHLNQALFCDACHIEMESESYYELALSLVGS